MDKELFQLLSDLGFSKIITNKFIGFKNGSEYIVFPKTKLKIKHYIATRKHLDMNGWLNKKEFNTIFLKIILEK